MNLFAYGTLQFPEVLTALTGRRLQPVTAFLFDYRRLGFADEAYPGIVADPGGSVMGVLYRGLDARVMRVIDLFEGDEYLRRTCRVAPLTGHEVPAVGYVVTPAARRRLSAAPWQPDRFEAEHLQRYLRRCRRVGAALRRGRLPGRWP